MKSAELQSYLKSEYGNIVANVHLDSAALSSVQTYNAAIRSISEEVIHGAYILHCGDTSEVYYVGMAGQMNTDGSLVNHGVIDRLQRQRTLNREKVRTFDWIKAKLNQKNRSNLNIAIVKCKEGVLAGFLEAHLIQKHYDLTKRIPEWNNKF